MPQECWERSCFLAGKLKDNFPSQRRWHFIRTLKEGWVSVDGEEQRAFQIKSFHWAHLSVSSAWWAHCTWVSTSCTCKQLMRRNRCRLELQPKGKPRSQGRGFFFFLTFSPLELTMSLIREERTNREGEIPSAKQGHAAWSVRTDFPSGPTFLDFLHFSSCCVFTNLLYQKWPSLPAI